MVPGRQVREALLRGTASLPGCSDPPGTQGFPSHPLPGEQRRLDGHTQVCVWPCGSSSSILQRQVSKEGGIPVGLHFGYTLLPVQHAPPAWRTMAALLLPRGGNPSAQITNAAFLVSPARASEKALASHLTQKYNMVPTSKLDALGMLLFTSTC